MQTDDQTLEYLPDYMPSSASGSIFMSGPMTDTDLFDNMSKCTHARVYTVSTGARTCSNCGASLKDVTDLTPDWRYYGVDDSRYTRDPTRVAPSSRREVRSVYPEILGYGFKEPIAHRANSLYHIMSVCRPFRGQSERRQSALFACAYIAHQLDGNPLPPEMINRTFGLARGARSRGIKELRRVLHDRRIKVPYVNIPDLVVPIIRDIYPDTDTSWSAHVLDIAERMSNLRYSLFYSSTPQAVACGIIYWYLTEYRPISDIPARNNFSVRVCLSDITVNKFYRHVKAIAEIKNWCNEDAREHTKHSMLTKTRCI